MTKTMTNPNPFSRQTVKKSQAVLPAPLYRFNHFIRLLDRMRPQEKERKDTQDPIQPISNLKKAFFSRLFYFLIMIFSGNPDQQEERFREFNSPPFIPMSSTRGPNSNVKIKGSCNEKKEKHERVSKQKETVIHLSTI